MDYLDFVSDMDKAKGDRSIRESVDDLRKTVSELVNLVNSCCDRIDRVIDDNYKMFPQVELIETLADSEEEKQEMLKQYLNLNDDF